jgi:hypothetical protein
MKNTRISTTISSKHAALLKKHTAEHGTQQSVLEHALECLDDRTRQPSELSMEEQLIIRSWRDRLTRIIYKDIFSWLMDTADIQRLQSFCDNNKMYMAFTIELQYQKPFFELSLKEVLEGLLVQSSLCNCFDTYNYSDDGDYYSIKIYHSLGLNGSRYFLILTQNALDAYGARCESTVSERTVFMKVFKNK